MDASQWEPIAARIAAAYPDAGFDETRREAYLETLAALPADAVSRAVDALLTEPRAAPPSAPVIRQAVRRADAPATDPEWLAAAGGARRSWVPALAIVSSALSAIALGALAVWWLWSGG